jgi:hypothetical protein
MQGEKSQLSLEPIPVSTGKNKTKTKNASHRYWTEKVVNKRCSLTLVFCQYFGYLKSDKKQPRLCAVVCAVVYTACRQVSYLYLNHPHSENDNYHRGMWIQVNKCYYVCIKVTQLV